MTTWESQVAEHYEKDDLGERILNAFAAAGKDPDRLTVADLAPVDAFHIRGRRATQELAALAEIGSDDRLIDVGCGIGGTSRYIASTIGCRVVGVDLTSSFCRTAEMLSERVGLSSMTEFRQASALDLPFGNAEFDVVWTEHVQMNIGRKARFYEEMSRVLKPGGRFAFHEIFAGPQEGLQFPVPWAMDASISHLITVAQLEALLSNNGLKCVDWEDRTAASAEFFENRLQELQENGPDPMGLHVIIGSSAHDKFTNMLRNFSEDRLRVVQAVMVKVA